MLSLLEASRLQRRLGSLERADLMTKLRDALITIDS